MKHLDDRIENLVSTFSESSAFLNAVKAFYRSNAGFTVAGLSGFATALFLYSFYKKIDQPILLITNDSNEAEYIRDDLELFNLDDSVCYLPEPPNSSFLFSDTESLNAYFTNDTLQKLSTGQNTIIVATLSSLKSKFPLSDDFNKLKRTYHVNEIVNRDAFIEYLVHLGYTIAPAVESPFEYCIKGGIIDFYPPESLHPYRIEFFGDKIESIRTFNPDTQLSICNLSSFTVQAPAHSSLDNQNSTNIFSYLKKDTVVFCLHAEKLMDTDEKNTTDIFTYLSSYRVINHYDLLASDIDFRVNSQPQTNSIKAFREHLLTVLSVQPDARISLFCANSMQVERLKELLGLEKLNYFDFSISAGAELPEAKLYFYTDHQIFKRERRINFFKKYSPDFPVEQFGPHEISPGDLMVHINYGVGRFAGLDKIAAFGSIRECLCLEYSGGDKVFVPLEKLNYVQKYTGNLQNPPPLNKLGTTEWERTKLKTQRAIDEISKDLVELYAKRISAPGYAFPPDNELQYLMESEFLYEETPDQLTAIQAVKEDMEKPRPMDRLLCGDVGFGKTEVAIRASFKAVSASKQVAVLVPTTILADQHFAVFSQRLQKYPIRIALLSRFVSRKMQSQIIRDLAAGKIDIVIGTHRLLSKDVSFKDLGLLVIDEEHRFGVKDKERIKFLRESVDILALSATPIPRSLNFSLIGVRDFSVINTPPISRLPVITEVITFDMNIIKKAILREINRGGQVFFVHNDIKSIAALSHKLALALPEISVDYVHGQMNERELEKTMSAFINNEINLLVTTTIIESGIDIPNANTIFINQAHHFGLAQLYQLRGRVGRSSRRAYAYLIVPEPSRIKPDALRKLQTIKKHTALGSGYSVALQDLEIRGAGNLLGTSQSGNNIAAIGYELYMKFLREALDEIKSTQPAYPEKLRLETEVFCPLPAYFPDSYISDSSARLEYYRQLTLADELSSVDVISGQIRDIYGKLPSEATTLFNISKIRLLASSLGIKKVNIAEKSTSFIWDESFIPPAETDLIQAIQKAASDLGLSYKFNPYNTLYLTVYLKSNFDFDKITRFLNLLRNTLNL
ncbi:MAG: transcription-repair coupling factor [Candidatus Neomarinimicrobiota bacterium]